MRGQLHHDDSCSPKAELLGFRQAPILGQGLRLWSGVFSQPILRRQLRWQPQESPDHWCFIPPANLTGDCWMHSSALPLPRIDLPPATARLRQSIAESWRALSASVAIECPASGKSQIKWPLASEMTSGGGFGHSRSYCAGPPIPASEDATRSWYNSVALISYDIQTALEKPNVECNCAAAPDGQVLVGR